MTYSTGIYWRLDFGIDIPDESVEGPGECVPLKEVAVCGPTRKRKISDVLFSEEDNNSVSLGGKAMRRSPRIAVKALKGLLEKKQKKAKELTQEQYLRVLRASKEAQILKKLGEEVNQLDTSLHSEMEAISGNHQSAAVSIYPRKEKTFSQELGTYHPVRLLFCPSGHYKLQVFIHKTVDEGQIDLNDRLSVERVIEVLRPDSGFVMCPGISDYDAIFADIRIQPSNVKEEFWPWRHMSARKSKLWHKPRKPDLADEMCDICCELRLARRQMLVVCDRRKSLLEEERIERQ